MKYPKVCLYTKRRTYKDLCLLCRRLCKFAGKTIKKNKRLREK